MIALISVHFGIFKAQQPDGVHSSLKHEAFKRKGFAKSSISRRLSHLMSAQRKPKQTIDSTQAGIVLPTRSGALTVDALIAITDLCLQGVFSDTVLCDILSLFSLGDIENDFCEVPSDTALLHNLLRDGLAPRSKALRAKLCDITPIRDVANIIKTVIQLREAQSAQSNSSGDDAVARLSSDEHEWIPLERFPSFTVSRWSQVPQALPCPTTNAGANNSSRVEAGATKRVNMIDILNGGCSSSPNQNS